LVLILAVLVSENAIADMAPDGSYVSGQATMAPDGSYYGNGK
jgi:hypothetical protein